MKASNKFFKLSFCLVLSLLVFSSCYKKKDTTAVVTVLDANESPVAGATVDLIWVNHPGTPVEREGYSQEATTNGSGKATFNYNEIYESGQAGVFVMDIVVDGDQVGIIKIEEETTSEETVYID